MILTSLEQGLNQLGDKLEQCWNIVEMGGNEDRTGWIRVGIGPEEGWSRVGTRLEQGWNKVETCWNKVGIRWNMVGAGLEQHWNKRLKHDASL